MGTHPDTDIPRTLAGWLLGLIVLIAIMVTVGGATRLTDSGLSITEWDVIMGTLPPLNDRAWEEAFAEYKLIPEYTEVNYGMTMAQFREIFWWEWGHRFLGRIIGLYVALPLLYWSIRGRVRGALRWRLWGLFALVGLQGVIGWFMVASGLSGRVDVSQYRLALHLGTAFILFGLVVAQYLALVRPDGAGTPRPALSRWWGRALIGAVFVQVILGAFVAGLRAGKTYNTWPLMDGRFVPEGYFGASPGIADLFERIAAVQFNHRLTAYLLMALAAAFLVASWRRGAGRYGVLVFGAMFAQMLLGIWTVIAAVPLWLGLVHQAGALAVFSAVILTAWDLSPRRGR